MRMRSQGAKAGAGILSRTPEQQAKRAEARVLAEKSKQELATLQRRDTTENQQLADDIDRAKNEQTLAEAKKAKQVAIHTTMQYYAHQLTENEYNPEILNRASAQATNSGSPMFNHFVPNSFERLTENDRQVLQESGNYTPEQIDEIVSPNYRGPIIRGTLKDGTKVAYNSEGWLAGIGFLKAQKEEARKDYAARTNRIKAENKGARSRTGNSALGRVALNNTAERLERPPSQVDLDNPEHLKVFNEEYDKAQRAQKTSSKYYTSETANEDLNTLQDRWDGELTSKDPRELKKDKTTMDLIRNIEAAKPMEPKHQDKLLDIAQLIALASQTGDLDEEATGIIDHFTYDLGSKLVDDFGLEHGQAIASYEAFRGVLRRAFAGTAQSVQETINFEKMLPNLGTGYGRVLNGFLATLSMVKAELEFISGQYPEEVMHVRFGLNKRKLNRVMNSINVQLEVLKKKTAQVEGKGTMQSTQVKQEKAKRHKSLVERAQKHRGGN